MAHDYRNITNNTIHIGNHLQHGIHHNIIQIPKRRKRGMNKMSTFIIPSIPVSHKKINMKKDYCCYDCKHLTHPFVVDETEVPVPTNPYCKLGHDKNFEKYQDHILSWINHPKYEWERCKHFKLKWSIRLHIRKSYWMNYLEKKKIWEG